MVCDQTNVLPCSGQSLSNNNPYQVTQILTFTERIDSVKWKWKQQTAFNSRLYKSLRKFPPIFSIFEIKWLVTYYIMLWLIALVKKKSRIKISLKRDFYQSLFYGFLFPHSIIKFYLFVYFSWLFSNFFLIIF